MTTLTGPALSCPDCGGGMTTLTLEGHYGRPVAIDVCHACQAFWFDGHESLQLAPASVLRLFRLIADTDQGTRPRRSAAGRCPRCHAQLIEAHDRQRQSAFVYRRCPAGHGRLITFFNFLREKDFIRPLSAAQIEDLRRHVQHVNCSNCGAPIDLTTGTACAHCGSPLSMLDVGQAEALIERLAQASAAPLNLVRARRDVEQAFAAFEREPGWYGAASRRGLVTAAIDAFTRWLR